MSCESKINLFLDKNDYILKITDDEIINVTGSVGSGKSTYGINYHDNKDYIVIDFDSIGSDNDPKTLTDDIIELRKYLSKYYKDLRMDEMNYYDSIIKFIKSKNKKGIIVGGHITHVSNLSKLKGTIIVKRTARIKCSYRAIIRDIKNPVYKKNKSFYEKIKRDIYCLRRVKLIKKQAYIEKFIDRLERYKEKGYE